MQHPTYRFTFCNIVLRHAFSHCFLFVLFFMLIIPNVDLMLFITFITICKASSIKIWSVLAAGLAENLIHLVFRQPFVIQHVTVEHDY